MTLAITSPPGVILLSVEYDPTGLVWCRLYDNEVLGWLVDETTASAPVLWAGSFDGPSPTKPAVTGQHQPLPIIIGSLAEKAPDTPPILSPQWCLFREPSSVFVPDLARVELDDFFTKLATNNGATRKLQRRFALSNTLHVRFGAWASVNPGLVFEGEPP